MHEKKHLDLLQQSIDFFFKDISLLIEACTHSSSLKKKVGKRSNNERLEFLGDAVLKLLISEYLFQKFPYYSEGDLSKLRSYLVSDIFISKLALLIDLGSYIQFSKAEHRLEAFKRDSILANAMEALVGACYLDKGLISTQKMYFKLFDKIEIDFTESIDFKSNLQEICQKNKEDLPLYTLVKQEGPEHKKEFYINVTVHIFGLSLYGMGFGSTKKIAEQLAAKQILSHLSSD